MKQISNKINEKIEFSLQENYERYKEVKFKL